MHNRTRSSVRRLKTNLYKVILAVQNQRKHLQHAGWKMVSIYHVLCLHFPSQAFTFTVRGTLASWTEAGEGFSLEKFNSHVGNLWLLSGQDQQKEKEKNWMSKRMDKNMSLSRLGIEKIIERNSLKGWISQVASCSILWMLIFSVKINK